MAEPLSLFPEEPKIEPPRLAGPTSLFPEDNSKKVYSQSLKVGGDTAARVLKQQYTTGLPVGVIERNLDEIETKSAEKGFDPEKFRSANPKVAMWLLQDKNNAALGGNDVGPLKGLEDTFNAYTRGFTSARVNEDIGALMRIERQGGALTSDQQADLKLHREKRRLIQEEDKGMGASAWTASSVGNMLWQQGRSLFEMGKGALYGGATGAVAGTVLPGVGNVAGGAAGATAGALVASAAYTYDMEANSAYEELSAVKDLAGQSIDKQTVVKFANTVGAINAGIEVMSDVALGKLLGLIPGGKALSAKLGRDEAKSFVINGVKKSLETPTTRAAMLKILGKMSGAGAIEGIEEFLQTLVGAGVGREGAQAASGKTFAPDSLQADLKEASMAAATAAVGTFLLGGIGGSVVAPRQIQQVRQAQQEQQFFQALGESVQASEVHKKLPEGMRDFVSTLKQEGSVENVYVNVDKWDALFQNEGQRAATEVFGTPDQYIEARALGADLVIPIEVYAEKLAGTEFHDALIGDMRLRHDSISANDAAEMQTKMTEILEDQKTKAEEKLKTDEPSKQVYQHIYDQLTPMMGEAEAGRNATIEAAKYVAAAEQLGTDAWTLYSERPMTIQRDSTGAIEESLKNKQAGDLVANQWGEEPNGNSYQSRITEAGRSDLLGWGRDILAPRVQAVFNDFSQRYGWGDPGNAAQGFPDRAPGEPVYQDLVANEEQQVYADGIQQFLSSEPDPSQAGEGDPQAEAGIQTARRDASAAVDSLRATDSVLALALSSDYAARQRTSLVGQTITSHEDLAVLAQVYRDPRFETFRIIFTGDSGKVVSQIGLTSRLPGATNVIVGNDVDGYLREISTIAQAAGATDFYMLHNHPSGKTTPSSADISLTTQFAARMPGLRMLNHIVIDTNEYTSINWDGSFDKIQKDFGQPSPPTHSEWGELTILKPDDVIQMAQKLHVDDDAVTLIVADYQHNVRGITTIPSGSITDSKSANSKMLIKATMRDKGAVVFAVGRNKEKLKQLSGLTLDSVHIAKDGSIKSMAETGDTSSKRIFPEKRRARLSPDTSRDFDYLRPLTDVRTAGQRLAANEELPGYDGLLKQEIWYSDLSRAVASIPAKAQTASGWLSNIAGLVKAGKVKQAEIDAVGLEEFLKLQTGKVTKQQISEFLDQNGVKVEETVLEGGAKYKPMELDSILDQWAARNPGPVADAIVSGEPWEVTKRLAQMHGAPDVVLLIDRHEDNTKYANYQLPGGTNYREVLLTLPSAQDELAVVDHPDGNGYALQRPDGTYVVSGPESVVPGTVKRWDSKHFAQEYGKDAHDKVRATQFKSGHWDQPNVLAHIRLNDRTDADGKRVLFVEEIQSDWGQKGKKDGFSRAADNSGATEADIEIREVRNQNTGYVGFEAFPRGNDAVSLGRGEDRAQVMQEALVRLRSSSMGDKPGVPAAPFVTKTEAWLSLSLKRIIKMAVDEGYDRVAFVNGEQSAARYDLSKQVRWIEWKPDGEADRIVNIAPFSGNNVEFRVLPSGDVTSIGGLRALGNEFDGKNIADVVGKDMAEKIMADKRGDLSGNGLKVGGSGMRAFYDKIVPNTLKDVLRKVGGGVMEQIPMGRDSHEGKPFVVTRDGGGVAGRPGFDTREQAQTWIDGQGRAIARELAIVEVASKAQPGFDITPAMREKVSGGVPLFQRNIRGVFHRGTNTITLLRAANPSTFQHEAAHAYLENLRRWVARPEASQQLKDDWATISKWAGITDQQAEIPNIAHEKWARGWEAYLMEGKSPSVELQSAFARMKDWLVKIYKTVLSLDVELNPEIRAVMDRTVATSEQIDRAREMAGAKEEILSPDWMTKAEKAAYDKLRTEARDEAETDIRTRLMNELVRERTDWWKEEKKRTIEEVTAEVNAQPVYIALSALQTGLLPDGREVPGMPEPMKLSREAIVAQRGEAFLKTLPKPYVFQMEGGLHPDIAAEMFGFRTGGEMLNALAHAPNKKNTIDVEVDARMMERHGDMMNDGSLSERAAEAIANEKQMAVYYREMQILLRQGATGTLTSLDAVKDFARRVIEAKKIEDISPSYYENAAAKAGRDAIRALIGKEPTFSRKLNSAFEARQRQILNLALFKEASNAKKAVDKSLKSWKILGRADAKLAKGRNMDMVNTARAILANFGIGTSDQAPAAFMEEIAKYDPVTYSDLKPIVDLVASERKPFRQLTMEEFSMVRDAVDGLLKMSRSANQMLIDGRKVDKEEVKSALMMRLDEFGKPRARMGYDKAVTSAEKRGIWLLGVRASLRRVESWVDAMDGGDFNGPFRRYIWQPISTATAQYRVHKRDVLKTYQEQMAKIEKSLTVDKIDAPELGYKFGAGTRTTGEMIAGVTATGGGRAELLGAMLHTGNESNLAKLLVGKEWATVAEDGTIDTTKWDAFIKRMQDEGILGKAEYDYLQATWDLLETIKPDAQKAHHEIYGYYFKEITAKEFNTPYGTYRGGYFPAVADSWIVDDAALREDKAALESKQNSFMFPTTGRGFTMKRAEGYKQPLMLDMRLVPQHIDKVLRFIHIEPRMKEVGRLMVDKQFRSAMNAFDPGVLGGMLMPWLQRSASQQITIPSETKPGRAFDNLANLIRSRTALQIMAVNVANALQQLTGGLVAMSKVSPGHLASSLWAYTRSPRDTAEMISEKSPFMRTQIGESMFEIQSKIEDITVNPTKYDMARDWSKHHAYILQSMFQNFVNHVTWVGAYNQAIEGGANEATAVQMSDSAVRQTQGTFNAEDISAFEVGTPLGRLFKMFYTYFNMLSNLYGTQIALAMRMSGFAGPARLFYLYFFTFMLPAVLAKMITQAMSGELWEDDDELLKKWFGIIFGSQVETVTAMVPFVGPAVMSGLNRFNDKFYDDRISMSPMFSMLEATFSVPFDIYDHIQGEGRGKKTVKDIFTLIGMVTGLPMGALARPVGYAIDVEEGNTEPANAADYIRGLVSGKGPR